mmetsp:Transcript_15703/g.31244  ORF Transcript_15703/g.31244 Transcript_15703/m.31244 type:complete len:303 (+) Transcript_15703:98-1006(+)
MRTYLKALFLSILVTQGVLVLRHSAGLSWAKGPGAAATARRPYLILVPVVNTNPRRQRRLLKNLCGLEYPPREDVTVSFLADAASMSILERKGLEECGYMVETHLEAAGARQAKDAAERHSLSVQMERRRMIAESRNTLLDSSLREWHEFAIWIDSDLGFIDPKTMRVLELSGEAIAVPRCANADGRGAYDLNSFQETEESLGVLRAMKKDEPVFEGYRDIGRLHMDDLAKEGAGLGLDYKVPLHGIGGTIIFTKTEIYRRGVRFATELVNGHYLETEGFAQVAINEGFNVVGLPNLVVTHA